MKQHLLCAAACTLPFLSSVASAALVVSDPPWIAPGGYSYSSSGGPAQIQENVRTYTSFDDTAYNSLYYAFSDAGPDGVWDTFLTDGPSMYIGSSDVKNPLSYDAVLSNLGTGSVTWSGSVTPSLYGNPTSIDTRFTMDITDTLGNTLALTDPTLLGLDAALGGVLEVTGDFKVTLNALMVNTGLAFSYTPDDGGPVICNTGDWCHALKVYDALDGTSPSEAFYTSTSAGFYSSPVPVPAAVWLFGSGLIGLIGVARRKKV